MDFLTWDDGNVSAFSRFNLTLEFLGLVVQTSDGHMTTSQNNTDFFLLSHIQTLTESLVGSTRLCRETLTKTIPEDRGVFEQREEELPLQDRLRTASLQRVSHFPRVPPASTRCHRPRLLATTSPHHVSWTEVVSEQCDVLQANKRMKGY